MRTKELGLVLLLGSLCPFCSGLAADDVTYVIPDRPAVQAKVVEEFPALQELRAGRTDFVLPDAIVDVLGGQLVVLRTKAKKVTEADGQVTYRYPEELVFWAQGATAATIDEVNVDDIASYEGETVVRFDEIGALSILVGETGIALDDVFGDDTYGPSTRQGDTPPVSSCQTNTCSESNCTRNCNRPDQGCLSYCGSDGHGVCVCVDTPERRPRRPYELREP